MIVADEEVVRVRQELLNLKGVQWVEHHSFPNNLHAFRIAVKDYAPIPEEVNERIPDNFWVFYIDASNYNSKWSHFVRVVQVS